MLDAHQVEELIHLVSAMDRESLTQKLTLFRGTFPVDFTPDFLSRLPLDRLRHILVALCLQNNHLPHEMPAAA